MEILFFAVIAVFIFFKLFEQFGKIDEDQKKEAQKKDAIKDFIKEQVKTPSQDNQSKLFAVPGVGIVDVDQPLFDEVSNKILNDLDEKLRKDFIDILSKTNLSPSQFVNGAKSAFEIILSAFALGDLQTLKPLISERIFLQFETEIKNRKSLNQNLNIKIISIDEVKIVDASLSGNFAQIKIAFTSKQVNYVANEKNEIVFGNKTEINSVKDVWTFKKDYTLVEDPNWILVSSN